MKIAIAALFLSILCFPAISQEMYKCGQDGKIVFQERPCKGAGSKIDVKPATGYGSSSSSSTAPTQISTAQTAPDSVASKDSSQLKTMQRERRLREIEHEIAAIDREILGYEASLDADLAALKNSKRYARNNLAGATFEQSVSTEMQAINEKYKTKISMAQTKQDRLRTEKETLQKQ